jgi:hypothetical protein
VRALSRKDVVRIGRNRDLPYSRYLYPNARDLVKQIDALIYRMSASSQSSRVGNTLRTAEFEESVPAHVTISASAAGTIVAQALLDPSFAAAFGACVSKLETQWNLASVRAIAASALRVIRFVEYDHREMSWQVQFITQDASRICVVRLMPQTAGDGRWVRGSAALERTTLHRSSAVALPRSDHDGWHVVVAPAAQDALIRLARETDSLMSALAITLEQLEVDPFAYSAPLDDDRGTRMTAVGDRHEVGFEVESMMREVRIVHVRLIDGKAAASVTDAPVRR